jgi:hypothetical protein
MDHIETPFTSKITTPDVGSPQPPAKISHTVVSTVSSWNWMTVIKILLIVIIVSALGFNILAYLAYGTDYLSHVVEQIASYLPGGLGRTLQLSARGTALGGEVAAGTIEDVEKIVTGATPTKDSTPLKHKEIWEKRDQNLSDAIDKRHVQGINTMPQHEPDQSDSSIQNQKGKWCYVGTDRGFRSCVEMENSQDCISGKIFPSKRKCVNPDIREVPDRSNNAV